MTLKLEMPFNLWSQSLVLIASQILYSISALGATVASHSSLTMPKRPSLFAKSSLREYGLVQQMNLKISLKDNQHTITAAWISTTTSKSRVLHTKLTKSSLMMWSHPFLAIIQSSSKTVLMAASIVQFQGHFHILLC
jgi:hypothetical protein